MNEIFIADIVYKFKNIHCTVYKYKKNSQLYFKMTNKQDYVHGTEYVCIKYESHSKRRRYCRFEIKDKLLELQNQQLPSLNV
jgi:hypothetical protein